MAGSSQHTTFECLISDGLLEIGDGYRAKNDELGGDGAIFLRAGHVTDSRIDLTGVERFHAYLSARVSSKMSKPGDTVVTTKGNSTGRTSYVTPDLPSFVYSPHLCYWRSLAPRRLAPRFLRYWAKSHEFQHQLRGMQASTDMAPYLSLTDQRRLRISLLPASHQHAIGDILGSLDDKIELNRLMSETLEAMARALFKSWFVDFDPVRAKTEGRQPSGMDSETAKLFPRGFEINELGEIPKGWTRAPLADWVSALSGGTPSKGNPALWGGTIPWISPKVMTEIHADEADDFVTPSAMGNGTRIAPSGSTLVMVRGMGLHLKVRVSQARGDVTFNQDVKALVPKGIQANLLLFALLDGQVELLGRVESSGHGTGKLPSEILLGHSITMPSVDVQARLARFFDALNDRIASSREQCRTLAAARDELLPRLLSGAIELTAAENFLATSPRARATP